VLTPALNQGLQAGIAVLSNDGRQEEGGTQAGASLFGDGRVAARRLARLVLTGVCAPTST
jgi:hypothetical protein